MINFLKMQKTMFKKLACLILSFFIVNLTSCSSKKVYLSDLNRSLNTLQLAIKYALKGRAKLSSNSRTYFSPYHLPGMDINALATNKKRRGRVIISINGNRRPYRITIAYAVEEYRFGKYRFDYYDKEKAKKYKEKIQEYLVSRPEHRDLIDDFQAY